MRSIFLTLQIFANSNFSKFHLTAFWGKKMTKKIMKFSWKNGSTGPLFYTKFLSFFLEIFGSSWGVIFGVIFWAIFSRIFRRIFWENFSEDFFLNIFSEHFFTLRRDLLLSPTRDVTAMSYSSSSMSSSSSAKRTAARPRASPKRVTISGLQ